MSLMDEAKSEPVTVRWQQSELELIAKARNLRKQNHSEFVRQAALDLAKETMLDNNVYELSLKNFLEFEKILNAPAKPNAKLKAFLNSKSPWE